MSSSHSINSAVALRQLPALIGVHAGNHYADATPRMLNLHALRHFLL